MSNLSERLAGRKMPHKDVPICLNLALLDERDEAMKAVNAAARTARADDDRMVRKESSQLAEAKARVAELEQRIAAESITLRIYGVDRTTYNNWLLACPPRKGKQEPFNTVTFFMHAAKNSAVYVDEEGAEHPIAAEEWAQLEKITDGEHDRIAQAVVHVNRSVGAVDVGFFVNASETIRGSSETSASRETSASPRAASGAGNQRKSTSKKPTKKAGA